VIKLKSVVVVWIFLVAVAMCVFGIWVIVNGSAPLLPAIVMLISSVALFTLGVMLAHEH
jgi:hypothetical protein